MLVMLCEQVAGGLITFRTQITGYYSRGLLKKELDDETKHAKGLLNDSYNQFLAPILAEVANMLSKTLKSEK